MAEIHVDSGQEQALARLKCAHCLSLIDYESMAVVIASGLLRNYRIDSQNGKSGQNVSDNELITAVQESINHFLRGENDSGRPAA